ncbi:MAG: thioredoxin family protein [Lentisphaeria bacterium]|nr:thioredoxin family protein [Lentisphaeria bacterium]
MRSAFSRFLLCSFVSCAALLFAPAGLRAADPAPKTDESGWVLPDAKNAGTGWHVRLKEARAEAAKENKPILVLFTGPDWSSASKKFESSVLRSKEYAESIRPAVVGLYIQHFVKTKAPEEQVDANQSLRKSLSVPAVYPCTVVLGSDGRKILGVIPGAPDKKEYLQQISKLTGIKLAE